MSLPMSFDQLSPITIHFKYLSILKVEILQESIKQQTRSTSSTVKLVLSNTKEIANI